VAEHLAFPQSGGQGRAIEWEKGPPAATTAAVQGPCHELFSGTRLTPYQQRHVGGPHGRDQLPNFRHGLAVSDHPGDKAVPGNPM